MTQVVVVDGHRYSDSMGVKEMRLREMREPVKRLKSGLAAYVLASRILIQQTFPTMERVW